MPQGFDKWETFLIRLGREQQARIMSELPNNLEDLPKHVKRYNEKNDEILYDELKTFIQKEEIHRKLTRPSEFFFFKAHHIVVTDKLSNIPLTPLELTGILSLLRRLNEDQIETVGQLPKELVILANMKMSGVGTVSNCLSS